MCGIAGIYEPNGQPDRDVLAAMVAEMAHRGPDGEGFWHGDQACLGMRRLAIVDPEHGDQPLSNETGTVQAVCNGEIYNHAELRSSLEQRGHQLASGADGEVLPHLWEEKGPDLLGDLNGIFAIALWDTEKRVLMLARDQLGVKPLYLCADGSRISFASEIKALLRDPSVTPRIDLGALDQHLTFRFTPSPRTLLEGVEKLPPASAMLVGDGTSRRWRYWSPKPEPVSDLSFSDAAEEFTERLGVAVRRQMMSDRPIGVMLSGGLDSALIAKLMADAGANVKTFTVGFEGGGLETNEIPLARESARLLGTQHRDRLIEQRDFQSGLERTIEILEEPISTSSALGFYEVSRLAREEVPVLLSGQGADEPLAGYWRHVGEWLAMGRVRRSALNAAGSLLRAAPGRRSVRLGRGLEALRHARLPDRFLATYAMFGPEEKRLLYSPTVAATLTDVADTAGPIEELRIRAAGRDSLQQMLYVDTRLWLPDDLLTVGDKTSMAASVEMRVPFLDRDLVEFVERLPTSHKLRLGRRKAIEKAAARKLLPKSILGRKERGFATPVGQWLREPGFFEFTREALLDQGSTSATLFDASRLQLLLDEHRSRTADHGRQLYTLLALELWCRRFLSS